MAFIIVYLGACMRSIARSCGQYHRSRDGRCQTCAIGNGHERQFATLFHGKSDQTRPLRQRTTGRLRHFGANQCPFVVDSFDFSKKCATKTKAQMSQYQNLPISTSTSTSTKKIFSTVRDQYQYSPSTDSTSTSTSTTNIDQIWPRNLKFSREKSGFSCGKFKFRGAILNFWVWNWNLKRKIWHILENFMAANLFTWFLLFFLFWYWYWLAQYLRDQYQYRVSTWKLDQYQYQYQYISTKNDQWTEKISTSTSGLTHLSSILCTIASLLQCKRGRSARVVDAATEHRLPVHRTLADCAVSHAREDHEVVVQLLLRPQADSRR